METLNLSGLDLSSLPVIPKEVVEAANRAINDAIAQMQQARPRIAQALIDAGCLVVVEDEAFLRYLSTEREQPGGKWRKRAVLSKWALSLNDLEAAPGFAGDLTVYDRVGILHAPEIKTVEMQQYIVPHFSEWVVIEVNATECLLELAAHYPRD